MTKLYLCVLLGLGVGTLSAQDYIPMLQEDHRWGVHFDTDFSDGYFRDLYIDGTEIINGNEYYKVWKGDMLTDCRWREENGIVYRLNFDQSESMVINFNLEVDDRLFIDAYAANPCRLGANILIDNLRVLSISTEFIAGENRLVLDLRAFHGDFPIIPDLRERWIEGIGSTRSITGGGYGHFKSPIHLACFKKNGVTTFFNDYTECENVLGTNTYYQKKISLLPNPITSTAILQFPAELGIDFIKVFDVSERLVKEVAITTDQITINNSEYASGLYFYQLFSENKIITSNKFIIK